MKPTTKYTVAYLYNGKMHEEEFEFFMGAFARQIQLEAYGYKPSLHEVGREEQKKFVENFLGINL